MTRFFDSHAWNTRNRDAATAVLRAVGLGRAGGGAMGYVSAEVADVTVRAGGASGVPAPRDGVADDPDWLGDGTAPQPTIPGRQGLG